ncbi:MAG: protein kinase [Myxococcales bacterium]|nr:protein kinase [Myxococcales bacterium]MCB9752968.1 protein kinase [Myxococcales bacterium]
MVGQSTDGETASRPPGTEEVARAYAKGPALAPGQRLGRYLVLEELGRGGMGVVVAAYDPELQRRVAVKVLRRADDRARLLREAQALARLNHPNVVAVHYRGRYRIALAR